MATPSISQSLSKFRLNDKPPVARRIVKRKRRILSCEQCHFRKVRCDRQKPCNSCVSMGMSDSCTYIPAKSKNHPSPDDIISSPEISSLPHTLTRYENGRASYGGITHWSHLVLEFEEGKDYVFGINPEFKDMYRKIKSLKNLYPQTRSTNFPFGQTTKGQPSKAEIIATLPSIAITNLLVDNYLNTIEKTHPLIHAPIFRRELSDFWENADSQSESWLSQLFMMLVLSLRSAPQNIMDCISQDEDMLGKFLDAAETSLQCSPFMTSPDLAAIRALCMMVIAQGFELVNLNDSSSLWILMGMVIRIAILVSLHRDPKWFPEMPYFEAEMRRRLWTTILVLDLNTAIDSGKPLLMREGDFDTCPPENINEQDLDALIDADNAAEEQASPEDPKSNADCLPRSESPQSEGNISTYTDSSFHVIYAQAYPLMARIIGNINSINPRFDPIITTEHDKEIRRHLQIIQKTFTGMCNLDVPGTKRQIAISQRTTLETILRRVQLALHHAYRRRSGGLEGYQASHWIVLESSLALLNYQQTLVDEVPLEWLADYLRNAFDTAMLYVTLAIRHGDFSTIPISESKQPAKRIAWTALQNCVALSKRNLHQSIHHFKVYFGGTLLITALKALESKTPLLGDMLAAGDEIVRTVENRKIGSR